MPNDVDCDSNEQKTTNAAPGSKNLVIPASKGLQKKITKGKKGSPSRIKSKRTLHLQQKTKATRISLRKVQISHASKDSVYAFGIHESDDETIAVKNSHYTLRKVNITRSITSQSEKQPSVSDGLSSQSFKH